jgi:hypothetical protein
MNCSGSASSLTTEIKNRPAGTGRNNNIVFHDRIRYPHYTGYNG